MREHSLYVKRLLVPLIADGSKQLEIRPAFHRFRQINPGSIIVFNNAVRRRVGGVTYHRHVTKAITADNADQLWPGRSQQEVLNHVRGFYSRWTGEYLIFQLAPP
jgi:ASC-1-like (ASCH) protein